MAEAAPAARRPPRALMKVVNPVLTALLRSPWHGRLSGQLAILTFTGRRSGRRFSTPVGYTLAGDAILIPTESRWQRNLRGGARVSVRPRGEERAGTAEIISDEAALTEAYAVMLAANPRVGEIVGLTPGPDGKPTPESVADARRRGHVVVRVRLDDGAAAAP
jgi:hypothetical protein